MDLEEGKATNVSFIGISCFLILCIRAMTVSQNNTLVTVTLTLTVVLYEYLGPMVLRLMTPDSGSVNRGGRSLIWRGSSED